MQRQKLSDDEVTRIKQRIEAGERAIDLAGEYQVSKALLSLILSGKRRATPQRTKPYATHKIIALHSGGTVILSYTVDLFEASEADRMFLLKLIDSFKQYEEEGAIDYSR